MKPNSTGRIVCIALGLLTLGSASLSAAEAPKQHSQRGTITSLDPSAKSLVVSDSKDKVEHRLFWDDQTKFLLHGKSALAADLKVGERVRLSHSDTGDLPSLLRVQIVPERVAGQP